MRLRKHAAGALVAARIVDPDDQCSMLYQQATLTMPTNQQGLRGMHLTRGRLIHEDGEPEPVGYLAHGAGFNGEPAFFELMDYRRALADGEVVTLEDERGRLHTCRALDATRICAVVAAP